MTVAILSLGAGTDGAADGFLKRKEDKNEWRAFVRFIAAASFEKEARFLLRRNRPTIGRPRFLSAHIKNFQ